MHNFFWLGVFVLFLSSCKNQNAKLPILGNSYVSGNDTIYPSIPDFKFVDQDSNYVTQEDFKNKVYVADFFFTHCPTICPKTTKQMLRIYEEFKENPAVALIAHSIDTKYDTVATLKAYANKLGIQAPKWRLVTGDEKELYGIADDYFSVAIKDPNSPGGFDHSGRLILVDKNRYVRSFCDGTDPEAVDKFMDDIRLLLKEK
jgi:protein SCO1